MHVFDVMQFVVLEVRVVDLELLLGVLDRLHYLLPRLS
jgi:hypothetical protein